MSRPFHLFLALVLWGSLCLARPTLAIAPSQDTAGANVVSRLEAALIATDSFQVLESRNIKAILDEQGFMQSGACDTTDCAVRIGQLLSVERMAEVRIRRDGDRWELSGKLVEVGTGQVLVSHVLEIHGTSEIVLQGGSDELAAILSGRKRPTSSRTVLAAKKPMWPWITAGGVLLVGGGTGFWYLYQRTGSSPTPVPSQYRVQLDWSASP